MAKATIKARNDLFANLELVRKGERVGIRDVKTLAIAREFDAEGLVVLHEVQGAAGVVYHAERNF